MLIYLAGPMRGRKFFNFPAFDAARDILLSQGYEVISPADMIENLPWLIPMALELLATNHTMRGEVVYS
jgi:hypothetical protein